MVMEIATTWRRRIDHDIGAKRSEGGMMVAMQAPVRRNSRSKGKGVRAMSLQSNVVAGLKAERIQ